MPSSIVDLIKSTRIFASLSPEASQLLLTKCIPVEVKRTQMLFHQGDPSDGVYLLISGRMSAEVLLQSGEVKTLGYIEPGETVGELGALSTEPRSLGVRALRDSKLFRISIQDFAQICRQFPSVMSAILNPIVTRSNSIIQMLSAGKADKHIVIFPGNDTVALEEFAAGLEIAAKKFENITFVTDQHDGFKELTEVDVIKAKIKEMNKSQKASAKIIYVIHSYRHAIARVAMRNADMVYIAVAANNKTKIDHRILDKIQKRRVHLRTDPALILIHPANTFEPRDTADWLGQANFSLYHHVRMDMPNDFARLLRFIRGRAVGVVLSGGGTRGWAHLGVIKALRDSHVPIDMIGGTSAGGVVAACYSTTSDFEEMRKKFNDIITQSSKSVSWRSLTWPAISIFNAKNFTQSQKNAFGETRIENLWLPFFCVSCNLGNNAEVVHRSGLLWETLRASTSIPGIIPPMVINGELHVDGGLLNNLPVDVMRNFIGNSGRVIAVELNSFAPEPGQYEFPPIVTFKQAFYAKMGWGISHFKFPNFVDTFLKGLFVGSLAKAKQNSLAANMLISLELGKFKLLRSNPEEAESMIQTAYAETIKQIQEKRRMTHVKPNKVT